LLTKEKRIEVRIGGNVRVNNLELIVKRFEVTGIIIIEKDGKKCAIDYPSPILKPGKFVLLFTEIENMGNGPVDLNISPSQTMESIVVGK